MMTLERSRLFNLLGTATFAVGFLLVNPITATATATAPSKCSGTFTSPGFIAPGTYSSLDVTGFCLGPATGNVIVKKNLTVEAGASLLANYPANAPGPEGDANFIVKGDVNVGKGGMLLLGCEPATGCANTTFDSVGGNVDADGALGVILHSDVIGGNVDFAGGGGGVNCTPSGVFALIKSPVFSDVEDNAIIGSLHISGLRSCYLGEFRNIVMGNNTVDHNTFADPDATEVGANTVLGNLACFGNSPAAQFGDSGSPPNIVIGNATGECAALSIH
jgi:hypothetical protein